ncbi:hypothetical protein HZB01_00260 [Candidatus Woesearchaeota archaeon]|nr:hypothetical protein [Candidatus Woesearchaeota archaeon]
MTYLVNTIQNPKKDIAPYINSLLFEGSLEYTLAIAKVGFLQYVRKGKEYHPSLKYQMGNVLFDSQERTEQDLGLLLGFRYLIAQEKGEVKIRDALYFPENRGEEQFLMDLVSNHQGIQIIRSQGDEKFWKQRVGEITTSERLELGDQRVVAYRVAALFCEEKIHRPDHHEIDWKPWKGRIRPLKAPSSRRKTWQRHDLWDK